MQDYKDIWNKVLAEIELEVSRANFLTLFKRTQLLNIEGDSITVAAPSAMIIDLLQRRFHDIIKQAADKQLKKDVKIIFAPKTIIDAVADKERKDGPLFETESKGRAVAGHLPRVRPDYTFANMAVSSSNQLAFVSASTVAKKPGETYNPLFIYGPTGEDPPDASDC